MNRYNIITFISRVMYIYDMMILVIVRYKYV